MAMHFEKHPIETAAREAAMVLRLSFQPFEEACAVLGRIALLRFASPKAEAEFAEQLRELARNLRARNEADGAVVRSILKGVASLERDAILLASSKT
ncbi:MAG TPA: hypothetical protein VNF29_14010 [Candidatus Binataceae bacterium]|nr:hypothetical protein [Candidatus Binataceae bacterium]